MNGTFFGSTRIGACLHAEHQATLSALNDLELLARFRSPPDVADETTQARLADIARVLEEDVTRHFGFEETELFPLLRQAGAGFMVDMLMAEHADIRPFAEELAAVARTGAAHGFDDGAWKKFRMLAEDIIDRETFHVQKEEMGLLGALSQVLTPEQDA
ncbi:MAG: hemerythrin domain-containing protein, partial [Rhodospirillaceae bacterium]